MCSVSLFKCINKSEKLICQSQKKSQKCFSSMKTLFKQLSCGLQSVRTLLKGNDASRISSPGVKNKLQLDIKFNKILCVFNKGVSVV